MKRSSRQPAGTPPAWVRLQSATPLGSGPRTLATTTCPLAIAYVTVLVELSAAVLIADGRQSAVAPLGIVKVVVLASVSVSV